ncbi:MAG: aldose 1-epimerase family protein [Pseudonocardiaceae bacterium]
MTVRWSSQRRVNVAGDWPHPSGEQWSISSGGHRANLVQLGGGLRSYDVDGIPLLAGYNERVLPAAAAGQVLAPGPDRLAGGSYTFRSKSYQLPHDEPELDNAIHGLTRWLPWECSQRHDDSVTLTCVLAPQPGYPWPLRLSTTWKVSSGGLMATHEATNLGDEPCPFGLGVYPDVGVADANLDQLMLQLPVTWRLITNERKLPISRVQIAGTEYDFRNPAPIGELFMDTSFTGVRHGADGTARSRLSLPDGSRGVEVWQDSEFDWLQVYTGVGVTGQPGEVMAIGPMTCPPDAFNSRENLIVLAPGQKWLGSWGIRPYV